MIKIHKSYIRLVAFEFVLMIALIINSFVFQFLNGINLSVFLLISLITFIFLLGNEKQKDRYVKDIILEVIIFLLIFFMLYYLSGLLLGFYKNNNPLNWTTFIQLIVPGILKIYLMERLRYITITKSENSRLLIVLNCILFFMIDITNAITLANFNTAFTTFLFISMTLLPLISKNIVASYLTLRFGYKPLVIYALATELYIYILPIIPNYDNYLYSLLLLLLPVVLLLRIIKTMKKIEEKEITRDYRKRNLYIYIPPIIIIAVLIYFTTGYFKYHAIAIGSGSMEPQIYKGDVVIIEKDKDFKKIKTGQVIAFKYNGRIIVHRVNKIIKNEDALYFYTKGDANEELDSYPVTEKDIIGEVNIKIPYIGIPTVWLNEI